MKKALLLSLVMAVIIIGCNNQTDTSNYIDGETPISQFQSSADYRIPIDLNDLEEFSDYVVKVEAINDLGDDVIDGQVFGSKKAVKVLESYGNEIDNDEIIIIEPAYVEDGEYVSTESYIKMDDGEEYILFLVQGDANDEYGVSALGFGKYSGDRPAEYSSITDFNTFGDIKNFGFISDLKEEIDLYEQIKEDVLKKYQ